MAATNPRELAELIMGWTDAAISPVDIAMRLAATDRKVRDQAMKIVRGELVAAAAEREVDADFARRGRYATQEELDVGWAKLAAQGDPHLTAADTQRFINVSLETFKTVIADHPDLDGAEFERVFRERLARRAGQ